VHTQNTQNHITGNDFVQIEFKSFYNIQKNHAYNTIQYNTKFVKRHVAVASEALKCIHKIRRLSIDGTDRGTNGQTLCRYIKAHC